mgnify:CR=1 FL=1
MRQVLSLSMPATEAVQLKRIAKKRGFGSLGSYIQFLFQADRDLISESQLLRSVREARKEYREGRSIKAKSLADLL